MKCGELRVGDVMTMPDYGSVLITRKTATHVHYRWLWGPDRPKPGKGDIDDNWSDDFVFDEGATNRLKTKKALGL